MKQLFTLSLLLVVEFVLATTAFAATYSWNATSGNWVTTPPTNWNPNTGTPGGSANGDYAYINNGGVCTLDSSVSYTIERLIMADAASNGILKIESGASLNTTANSSSYVYLGRGAGLVGAIFQTGGTVTLGRTSSGNMRMAYGADTNGYYGLSGGELNCTGAPMIGAGGTGLFELSGGSFNNAGTVYLGNNGGLATLDITGGNMYVGSSTGGLQLGRGGDTVASIRGTGDLICHYALELSSSGSSGIFNLGAVDTGGGGGGAITTYTVKKNNASATGIFNFHGGTLKAAVFPPDNTDPATYTKDFMTSDVTSYVYSEDAVINTDGLDVTVSANLLKPTGNGVTSIPVTGGGSGYIAPPVVKIERGAGDTTGVGATAVAQIDGSGAVTGIVVTNPGTDYSATPTVTLVGGGGSGYTLGTITTTANATSGGLQKLGLGTLTLAGANDYAGDTEIQAGALSVTGSITSDVSVWNSAALKGTGTITGDVVAAAGSSIEPGESIGTLTVTGNVTVGGTLDIEYDGTDPETTPIDVLAVSGILNIDGAIISFSDLGGGAPLDQPSYVFATYGTLSGTPNEPVGVPVGYQVEYGDNSAALVLIPEPATWTLLLLAGLAYAAFFRRRR